MDKIDDVSQPTFGISTYVFRGDRLARAHLAQLAEHGFATIELVATRSHFDYHDDDAVALLATWLDELGLRLHSVHAPIAFSIASSNESRRATAAAEVTAALAVARRLPFSHLVVHLGQPSTEAGAPDDNQRDAALKSLEAIARQASDASVRLALEVLPNALSSPDALVRLIEEDANDWNLGVCFDYGHAHVMGDLGEAIETLSGHMSTTHVHDNRGVRDEHLPPFAGAIDWDAAMMETQKVGYDGVLMFEVGGHTRPADVLARAAAARARLEQILTAW